MLSAAGGILTDYFQLGHKETAGQDNELLIKMFWDYF